MAGFDCTGHVVMRRLIKRFRLLNFLSGLLSYVVAMEAYGRLIMLHEPARNSVMNPDAGHSGPVQALCHA